MSNGITISECICLGGVNAMLKQMYFDMVTDQTEGVVLQLQFTPNLHVLLAKDEDGNYGFIYAIKTSKGCESHVVFPPECRGQWAVEAVKKSIAFMRKEYGVKLFTSGRYSCHRAAGFFLHHAGFKRVKSFNTSQTKDGVQLSYITYKLEVK